MPKVLLIFAFLFSLVYSDTQSFALTGASGLNWVNLGFIGSSHDNSYANNGANLVNALSLPLYMNYITDLNVTIWGFPSGGVCYYQTFTILPGNISPDVFPTNTTASPISVTSWSSTITTAIVKEIFLNVVDQLTVFCCASCWLLYRLKV
jgi:hypothetical protein